MAHGFCFLWEPGLVRLHVISDIITGLAYYAIAIALFYFIYKRRDIPFPFIFVLFALFILACGTTHLSAAYTVYIPKYWEEGVIKAITAFVSVVASILFIPLIPKAIALPSLTKALDQNKKLNSVLEKQVEELRRSNQRFNDEITERKRMESALRASEEKYRTLIQEINDGIFVMDERGNFTFVNNAFARIHGFEKPDDLIGKNFVELTPPEGREALRQEFSKNIESGRDPGVLDIPIERPDKGRAYIQVHPYNIIENGRVVGTRGIMRDITEHRILEEQLRHAQKLEGIGELAGGVAHDFNNVLSAIVGFAGLLQIKMDKADPLGTTRMRSPLRAREAQALLNRYLPSAGSRCWILNPRT